MNKPALQLVSQTDDQALESMISEAKERMVMADARNDTIWKARWAAVMALLIGQRSGEQVARMESRIG